METSQMKQVTDSTSIAVATQAPKKAVEINLPVLEIWRWKGNVYSHNSPSLLIVGNYLILATRDPDLQVRLIVFNVTNGDVIWDKPFHSSPYSYDFDSLYADKEQIYIGSLNYVQAFELSNGELLWTGAKQPWGRRGTLDIYYQEEVVEAYSDYTLYILDPQTGKTIETIESPEILMKVGEKYYETYDPNYYVLEARNITTDTLFWSKNLHEKIQLWPIFTNDKMYLSLGADYGIDDRQIVALSTKDGQILWRSEGYVSNMALSQDLLFAIKGDASIVAIDVITGAQIGAITVEPAQTYQYKGTQHWGDYLIAASNKYVATYYSDSQEFIVFERTDVEP
jgi:outer membrane protein assembly factor BamB